MTTAMRSIELPSGRLDVHIHEETPDFGLNVLCDFAARNNPKRGFLVVSKVLGRHIPSDPLLMHRVHGTLAAKLASTDLPGPVVFMGMAETAICLGQAVHDTYANLTERQGDTMFLHSTRQILDGDEDGIVAEFSEPHSHAARHIVYSPLQFQLKAMLKAARSLVLIDDESSTGTTFMNAARAMAQLVPCLQVVSTAVITDWSNGADWRQKEGWKGASVALLRGELSWHGRADFVSETPPVTNTGALGHVANSFDYGRRGTATPYHRLPAGASYAQFAGAITRSIKAQSYLVVGTGEFTYPAYRLALAMRERGHKVCVQATTRSPVHLGGAIGSVLRFADNYGADVPNFLYNAQPIDGQKVIIVCETGEASIDPTLVEALDAHVIALGSEAKRKAA